MFYYRKGDIVSNAPWSLPTIEAFDIWLDEWSKTPYVSDYSVYLAGAFCENYFFNGNRATAEIDVILKSDPRMIINYSNLKNILAEGIKIGFKNKLLIDIFLVGELPTAEKLSHKTINYGIDRMKQSDTEFWQWDLDGHTVTELIPGLYESIKVPTFEYNKYISKNYTVPCKQIELKK